MKKLLLMSGVAAMLFSCGGGPTPEDYENAAAKMCSCMDEKLAAVDPADEYYSPGVDFAFCALDVAFEFKVDSSTDEFAKALNAKCSNLSEMQKDYAKNANE